MPKLNFPKTHYIAFSIHGTNQFLVASTTDPRKPEKLNMQEVPSRFTKSDDQVKYYWPKLESFRLNPKAAKEHFIELRKKGWYVDPENLEAFCKRHNI